MTPPGNRHPIPTMATEASPCVPRRTLILLGCRFSAALIIGASVADTLAKTLAVAAQGRNVRREKGRFECSSGLVPPSFEMGLGVSGSSEPPNAEMGRLAARVVAADVFPARRYRPATMEARAQGYLFSRKLLGGMPPYRRMISSTNSVSDSLLRGGSGSATCGGRRADTIR